MMKWSAGAALAALVWALSACGGGGSGDGPGAPAVPLEGSCPAGFVPDAGENRGFPSGGVERVFHVLPPEGAPDSPRPLFVSLTGTVQRELDFAAQSGLDDLPRDGWIVAAPDRTCSQNGTNCAQFGSDGRIWEPWYDGTIAGPSDDEGPDVRFVEAMVRCIATVWPVDAERIYVGGISAGGSFTNRNLTFNSELFAGGVASSGNWYGGLAAPASPRPMGHSIAIVIWGGPSDVWPPVNPLANYDPETKQAALYYAAQPDVITVSCTGSHGHIWPTAMTPWLASTLLSFPKGADPADFALTPPPEGFSCVLGEYTDH
jgi:poly(3-hydroxybutyrate) depolymerase